MPQDTQPGYWSNPEDLGLTSESIEVRNEHCMQFYRSQFETESDFRDSLMDFILVSMPPFANDWKLLCSFETRSLCGLFNLSLEDEAH